MSVLSILVMRIANRTIAITTELSAQSQSLNQSLLSQVRILDR